MIQHSICCLVIFWFLCVSVFFFSYLLLSKICIWRVKEIKNFKSNQLCLLLAVFNVQLCVCVCIQTETFVCQHISSHILWNWCTFSSLTLFYDLNTCGKSIFPCNTRENNEDENKWYFSPRSYLKDKQLNFVLFSLCKVKIKIHFDDHIVQNY